MIFIKFKIKNQCIFIVVMSFLFLFSGCSTATKKVNDKPIDETIDKSKPEIKVIYDFAENINNKSYTDALNNLENSLKGVYSMQNNAPLRNIEHMEISKLIDKTSEWSVDDYIKNFSVYKVFYSEVNYKVNNIIDSSFKNGVFYHKIVTVKVDKDSPWQIAEMSTATKIQ